MTLPKTSMAADQCEEYFARALASERGIAVTLSHPKETHGFRQRMNSYREGMRKNARKVFPPDDPRYGVSIYDNLRLTIDPENPARVLIRPFKLEVEKVQEL